MKISKILFKIKLMYVLSGELLFQGLLILSLISIIELKVKEGYSR